MTSPARSKSINATVFALILAFFSVATLVPVITKLSHIDSKAYAAPIQVTSSTNASENYLWQEAGTTTLKAGQAERSTVPVAYRILRLNADALTRLLDQTSMEFTTDRSAQTVISLPMPEGRLARFRFEQSPIMEAGLAAQYPEIKTYRGQGIDDPTATTRFDWTPAGFHAILLSDHGTVIVEPYSKEDTNIYISYYKHDMPKDEGHFQCLVPGDNPASTRMPDEQFQRANNETLNIANGTTLRTYRLAVAATGEYTQTYGRGTVNGTLAAITTNINLVNAIYERELAIRLVLVNSEAAIISTNAATDGYTNNDSAKLVDENQKKLDSIVGSSNYDIGFVFDSSPVGSFRNNIQGLAGVGIVCVNGEKGQAVVVFYATGPSNLEGIHSVAHETGHQFGASHTFNGCGSFRIAETAYEPGSGVTVMSYGFLVPPDNRLLCGSQGLHSAEVYFHTASLEQIVNYITVDAGSSCPRKITTGNNAPSVEAGKNHDIPRSTPFTLTATGSDSDGDALTYCWEEFDRGAAAPPDTDNGTRPIFRSFAPVSSRSRTFPQLSDILTGTATFGESLPTTTRTMNFRVTARDNHSGGGGITIDDMRVHVKSNSGPFTVTQPGGSEIWAGGSLKTVTWDVANTSSVPVNCKDVAILLSTDGGSTFPIVLASNTPNDGSEPVTVPNIPTNAARIKVEAIGNIFFNISKANLTVVPGIDCSFNVDRTSQNFGTTGGSGSVRVTATDGCDWIVSNIPGWILITSGSSGIGGGMVNYSVAANTGPSRTGTLTIAGQNIAMTQAPADLKIIRVTVSGKKLIVSGEGFDEGAVILLNGEKQKTVNDTADPSTSLVAKKSGKKIKAGDRIQVRNADGRLSQEFIFTSS
jgi:hypothetical protein